MPSERLPPAVTKEFLDELAAVAGPAKRPVQFPAALLRCEGLPRSQSFGISRLQAMWNHSLALLLNPLSRIYTLEIAKYIFFPLYASMPLAT